MGLGLWGFRGCWAPARSGCGGLPVRGFPRLPAPAGVFVGWDWVFEGFSLPAAWALFKKKWVDRVGAC